MKTPPKPKRGPKAKPGPGSPIPPGKNPAWRSEGWQPSFDAASLVDYVADVVLGHTRDSILAGKVPSGEEQLGLNPDGARGRKAAKGKRPDIRGWTGRKNALPLKIRRAKMRVTGTARASGPVQRGKAAPTVGTPTKATVRIRPGKSHRAFVAREAKADDRKGKTKAKATVGYFSVEGEVAKLVDAAIAKWLERALAGDPPAADPSEHDADEVP